MAKTEQPAGSYGNTHYLQFIIPYLGIFFKKKLNIYFQPKADPTLAENI